MTTTRRIMIVDDNVDNAEMLGLLLQMDGDTVSTVHTGVDALDALAAFRPHAMFVDIGLPDLDGYEVARRVRADPANAKVLLVALTGWGSSEDKRRAKDAGFDIHLTKPAGADAVQQALLLAIVDD